ncbi:MAG: cytosine permease, partial [Gammaproteobacteria bacterium]|nr:cytosine permease [Gammaproteobacteria bacterium]
MEESPLYSADLAPAPESRCTWDLWSYAAIWVGMAVCIPTWLLASYMIRSGLDWTEALVIIFVGNLIVTVPMILNGHAG